MTAPRPPGDQVKRDQGIRVVCYARVNGAPTDQARLLDLQRERMRRFARERAGWTIVGEFSDVTTRRPASGLPGLRQALAEAGAGACDVFLVDSLDRVSRLTWEFAAAVEKLSSAGVTLPSAAEPFTDGLRTLPTHTCLLPGFTGLVGLVDGVGTVPVLWENGDRLGLIPGIDSREVADA